MATSPTTPVIYVREARNVWHVARPPDRLVPEVVTLCRRAPVTRWDMETMEHPATLCKRCAQLAARRRT